MRDIRGKLILTQIKATVGQAVAEEGFLDSRTGEPAGQGHRPANDPMALTSRQARRDVGLEVSLSPRLYSAPLAP